MKKNGKKTVKTSDNMAELLLEMAKATKSYINSEKTWEQWLESVSEFTGADICFLRAWNEYDSALKLLSSFVKEQEYPSGIEYVPEMGDGIDHKAIDEEKVQVVADVENNQLFKFSRFIRKEKILSIISFPMIVRNKAIGVLTLYFKDRIKKTDDLLELILFIASQIAFAMDIDGLLKAKEKLIEISRIDETTGLYNLKFLEETVDREIISASRFRYSVCLAVIRIDNLHEYIEEYGSSMREMVLRAVIKIIGENTSPYDLLTRSAEDELVLVLPHSKSTKVFPVMDKIRKEIQSCKLKGAKNAKFSISIGLSTYPDNANTKTGLFERARQALYLSEKDGGNRITSSLVISRTFIKFGFCPPILHPFYNFVLKGVKNVTKDFHDIQVIVRAPEEESETEQLKAVEYLMEEGVDAIAICSKTPELISRLIQMANNAGVLVFFFNIVKFPVISGQGEVVSSIGYDQMGAGRNVGEYLVRLLRKKGKVAVLEGRADALDSIQRKEGFLEVMKEYPEIEVAAVKSADWDREKARKAARAIIKANPGIDAFFAVSDEMALGAQDVIEDLGKKGEIFIVGLDGNQNALNSIREGGLTATLNTNPVHMGEVLMRTVIKSMIKEEKIEPLLFSSTELIDMGNIGYSTNK